MRQPLYQNFIKKSPTSIEKCDTVGSWSAVTNCTLSLDIVNLSKDGSPSLKCTSTVDGGAATFDIVKAYDFSTTKNFNLTLWTDDVTTLSQIVIYVISSGGNYSYAWPAKSGSSVYWIRNGKNSLTVPKQLFTKSSNGTWSGVTKIRVRVESATGVKTIVSIADIEKDSESPYKIAFTFDDGYLGVIEKAYPIFAAAGIKGTCYVISDAVGAYADRMTLADLHTLYDAGWDISNHTKTHTNLTTLDYKGQYDEIKGGQDWLIANGFIRSAKHLCYPEGAYNDITLQVCKDLGVLTARTIEHKYNVHPIVNWYRLQEYTAQTSALLIANANEARLNQALNIATFHDVSDTPTGSDIGTTILQTFVDYNVKTKADAVTMSEIFNQRTNPRKSRGII